MSWQSVNRLYCSIVVNRGPNLAHCRRAPNPKVGATYYLTKISRKLYENEENWVNGRGGASEISLCRSATALDFFHYSVCGDKSKFLIFVTV